jgi:hypothetical protein
MPPNRKSNVDVVEGIASLNLQVASKYAPLTTMTTTTATQPASTRANDVTMMIHAPHTWEASHPTIQYWDWPSEAPSKQQQIDQILKEEATRQLLSVENLESNLTQTSQSRHFTMEAMVRSDQAPDESYWNWSLPKRTFTDDYWYEPSSPQDAKQQLIRQILQEEQIRQEFSVEHVESKLVQNADHHLPASTTPMVTPSSSGGGDASYWDW